MDADLAEAHNALGNYYVRVGRYEDALAHFDRVVFSERKQGRTSAVTGWRANVLFNLGEGRAAFREINGLVTQGRQVWLDLALVRPAGRAEEDAYCLCHAPRFACRWTSVNQMIVSEH